MTRQIKFGSIVIGEPERVVVIAEAACEHQGSLESAKRLVELAKNAGPIS